MVVWARYIAAALLPILAILPRTQAYPYAYDDEDTNLASRALWNRATVRPEWDIPVLSELVPRIDQVANAAANPANTRTTASKLITNIRNRFAAGKNRIQRLLEDARERRLQANARRQQARPPTPIRDSGHPPSYTEPGTPPCLPIYSEHPEDEVVLEAGPLVDTGLNSDVLSE